MRRRMLRWACGGRKLVDAMVVRSHGRRAARDLARRSREAVGRPQDVAAMAGQRLPIAALRQMCVAPQFGQPLGLGGDYLGALQPPHEFLGVGVDDLGLDQLEQLGPVVPSCGRRGEAGILDEMAQIERFANRLPSMIVDPDADPTAAAQHLPRRNGEVGAASLRAAIDVLEQIGEAHGRRRLRLVDRHVLPGAQRGARIERCGHADVGGEPRRETGAMPASIKRFAPVRAIVHHHSRQCLKHDLGAFPGGERAVMAKGRDPRRDAARVDRRRLPRDRDRQAEARRRLPRRAARMPGFRSACPRPGKPKPCRC